MSEEEINDLIDKKLSENYRKSTPLVAPHNHDGVDNLALDPSYFLGFPIFVVADSTVAPTDNAINGTVRFQYDPTNFAKLWFRANRTWYMIGSSGGGGTPGGNDTNVQFNDGGNFGGEDTFDFNKTDVILTLDKGTGQGDGAIITGGTSDLHIFTDEKTDGSLAGDIHVIAGSSDDQGGRIRIAAGEGTNGSGFVQLLGDIGESSGPFDGGTIYIKAGADVNGAGVILIKGSQLGGQEGSIEISPGNDSLLRYGEITLFTGLNISGGGGTRGNVQIPTGCLIVGSSATGTSTNTAKSVIMFNTSDPSGATTGAGILYVKAGALYFMGSGGTITNIAPA